jgi:hypothetical protein
MASALHQRVVVNNTAVIKQIAIPIAVEDLCCFPPSPMPLTHFKHRVVRYKLAVINMSHAACCSGGACRREKGLARRRSRDSPSTVEQVLAAHEAATSS